MSGRETNGRATSWLGAAEEEEKKIDDKDSSLEPARSSTPSLESPGDGLVEDAVSGAVATLTPVEEEEVMVETTGNAIGSGATPQELETSPPEDCVEERAASTNQQPEATTAPALPVQAIPRRKQRIRVGTEGQVNVLRLLQIREQHQSSTSIDWAECCRQCQRQCSTNNSSC
jgi:hypothetical protein